MYAEASLAAIHTIIWTICDNTCIAFTSTSNNDFELITISDGSMDGVEYFNACLRKYSVSQKPRSSLWHLITKPI